MVASVGVLVVAGSSIGLDLASGADVAARVHAVPQRLKLASRTMRPAGRIAPGDRVERLLELSRSASEGSTRVTLRVSARRRSRLTGARQGLRLSIAGCSRPWTRKRGSRSYACLGARRVLLAAVPLLGKHRLGALFLPNRSLAHLRLTLTFPPAAGNALQGQTTTLVYRFTAVAGRG